MEHAPGAPVAAVDVGGTTIKAVRVDAAGVAHPRAPEPTPIGADGVIAAVAELVRRMRDDDPGIAAVGVVVPGIVDAARGIAVLSENLQWRDAPMRDLLVAATGLPVALDHDVRAAARAEHRRTGERDLAVLVIGTGIAAGLIVDGTLLDAGGAAGELGHTIVVPDGPSCVCGSRGCLEAVASAAAIARLYEARTGRAAQGAGDVLARSLAGDAVAQEVWQSAVDALAVAIRQLVAITGARTIALAGGLSLAGDALVTPLRQRVAETLTLQAMPEVRAAIVGASGGLLGAVDLARRLAAEGAR